MLIYNDYRNKQYNKEKTKIQEHHKNVPDEITIN